MTCDCGFWPCPHTDSQRFELGADRSERMLGLVCIIVGLIGAAFIFASRHG